MKLFDKIRDIRGSTKHEAPPQSKVVTGKFTPTEQETPELPPRNRAERRHKNRDRVRASRAVMRAQGKKAHLRRKSRSEIFLGKKRFTQRVYDGSPCERAGACP